MTALTRVSLAHRTVIILLTLLIAALGTFLTGGLKQELIPSMDLPRATVVAIYPGAAPEAVERDVAKPIEAAVKAVNGVTKVTSVSSSGVAQVKAEWDYGTAADKVAADIRTAVDGLKATMPSSVTTRVAAGSFNDIPVMILAVSSDGDAVDLAAKVRETVLPQLKAVAGVRDVTLSGEQQRQVSVTLHQDKINSLGVDISGLSSYFTADATAVPAGTVLTGTDNLDVQVGRTWASVDDIANMRVQGTDGPVKLSQVADVKIEPVPTTSLSRVNGKPSLTVMVTKTVGGNTVTVAEGVRKQLPALAAGLGQGAAFATVFDQSPFIEQSIHDLSVEGGLGLAMAILVILLFLGSIRATVITAVSIPLSLFIAMIGLYVGHYTLNILTLGALTVAIGRVVDDSIVVIENIKRHQSLGETGSASIMRAVKEVAGAVTSSTLTTVAVFLPIGIVGGQSGELFRPFAVTVTVALVASLVVSLTVVPVLASWLLAPRTRPLTPAQQDKADARAARLATRQAADAARTRAAYDRKRDALTAKLAASGASASVTDARLARLASLYSQTAEGGVHDEEEDGPSRVLQRAYLPALRWALGHRALTLGLAAVLFLGTMAMAPRLKTDFIGDAGQVNLTIIEDLPAGSSLQDTDKAARKVEQAIASEPTVQTYSSSIGATTGLLGMGQSDTNHATFSVALYPHSKGTIVADSLRAKLAAAGDLGTIQVVVGQSSSNVIVYVTGNDQAQLKAANAQVVTAMQGVKGLSAVTSDLAASRQMLDVRLDQSKASAAGMTQGQVGLAVTRAVRGQKVGTLTTGDTGMDVLLFSTKPVTSPEALARVVLPVTPKQTADARQAASDKASADSTAFSDRQKADAAKAYADQVQSLKDARATAKKQVATYTAKAKTLNAALAKAQASAKAAAAAAAAFAATPPTPVPAAGTIEQQVAAIAAIQAYQAKLGGLQGAAQAAAAQVGALSAQSAQLTAGIAQLQAQIDSLSTQQDKLAEARAKTLDIQATQQELTDAAKDAMKAKADPLRLGEIGKVVTVDAPAQITRVEGARTATVTATPTGTDLGATSAELARTLAALDLPPGVTVKIGGVSQQQQESFVQLGLAMLVAIGIVYLIMVGTFGSLIQPLMLLVSIPFAATGAVGLLLLTNTPLGIPSMIGLLMLIGIVVTNAIVLVDLINQFRRRGASVDDAVLHGARLRLRPIVMTALATIMALIPMALGVTGGGVFISKPLAIVVIGGLVTSTILTLVLVPVLYDLVEQGRGRLARRRAAAAADAGSAD